MTPIAQVGDTIRITEYEHGAALGELVVVAAVEDEIVEYKHADLGWSEDILFGAKHSAYEIVTAA